MKRIIVKKIKQNQNRIVESLSKKDNKILFIKSIPQTGKTTILKDLFDSNNENVKIFVTGCNPQNMTLIDEAVLLEIDLCLRKNQTEKVSIYFDEYYNDSILNYFEKNSFKNVSVFITTNRMIKKPKSNIEIIDIYNDVLNDLDKYMLKIYNLDITEKILERKLSLIELIKIGDYIDKNPESNYKLDEILNILNIDLIKLEKERFLPTTTAILCINKDFKTFKTFDFEN